ncbi:hypothetical protein OK727_02365 [Streptococcus pneumoniae]|nr:hypothetical protein [Streptococcus pneumoniae]
MSEYALYQGDVFITLGTLAETSKETGIAERMLKYYTFASTQRRNPNGRAVVKIEVE